MAWINKSNDRPIMRAISTPALSWSTQAVKFFVNSQILFCALLIVCVTPIFAKTPPGAAIATAHPLATRAGHEILAKGGNAFDAAIAISAVLAVVEPTSSGFGGGGFWLLHRAKDNFQTMIDGREQAPLAAHRDLYLNTQGNIIPRLSLDGPLAAGIPGQAAALDHIAKYYGKLSLSESLAPAIQLARDGFKINKRYQSMARWRLKVLQQSPAAAAIFLHDNEIPGDNFILRQADLARTLAALAQQGRNGFYTGPVAQQLVDGVRKAGGIWTMEDLSHYKVIERKPITGHYQGLTITSAAPPSSGGIAILTILNILSHYPLETLDHTDRKHLIIEAMRRAYRDRADYLGDPDFTDIAVNRLISPDYAAGLAASIRMDRATASQLLPGSVQPDSGTDTTHFSVIDTEGNRVSATLSINYPFGSGFVPPGTGILLNDEMDDFSSKPGTANGYGLIGGEANAIAPGKRPLSSMSPSFIENDQRVAILGTPGGSRIITMVLLGILDFAAGNDPESWVSVPRFHHQFLPDQISYEPEALNHKEINSLEKRGHFLKVRKRRYGNMQAVLWDIKNNTLRAASDPRGTGLAEVKLD